MIEVRKLTITDKRNGKILVNNMSFNIRENKCLAIVGESGSGKSMTVKTLSGLHKPWIDCKGKVIFQGKNLLDYSNKMMKEIRGKKCFMIFQDSMSALDPSCKVGASYSEILEENLKLNKKDCYKLMIESMNKVLLSNPEDIVQKYPHQLSGGMLQRVIISIAISLKPEIIIADEPTTALDTITQYEVIKELIKLKEEFNATMVLISHDLGVVREIADYVLMMKNGEKVEEAKTEEIFKSPKTAYSKHLIKSRKRLGNRYRKLTTKEGKSVKS